MTGNDENAFVPMNLSAAAAMLAFAAQSRVPRIPLRAGNR